MLKIFITDFFNISKIQKLTVTKINLKKDDVKFLKLVCVYVNFTYFIVIISGTMSTYLIL